MDKEPILVSSEEENSFQILDVVDYPVDDVKRYVKSVHFVESFKIQNHIFYLSDIVALLPGHWLNDKVINFYYKLLSEVYTKTYFFNTFAYLKIADTDSEEELKVHFNDIDFNKYDTFIFPIHTSNHWSTVKIDRKYIVGYDSLGSVPHKILDNINWFYMNVIIGKFDENRDLIIYEDVQHLTPKQMNCDDCGVFCCMYAKYYHNTNIFFNFPRISTMVLRYQMIHEILAAKILYY